jgi:ankyrin repeat protein
MDGLSENLTPNDMIQSLPGLRTGVDAYKSAYEAAMERVTHQTKGKRDLAMRIFAWIVHAKRQLSIEEVTHALATRIDKDYLDSGDFVSEQTILSVCAGLVVYEPLTSAIQLVHYTTQEYFREHWKDWFMRESAQITATCMSYLGFEHFASDPSQKEKDEKREKFSLLSYAAMYWGYHDRELERMTKDWRYRLGDDGILFPLEAAMSFLRNERLVRRAARVMNFIHDSGVDLENRETFVLNMVAEFGVSCLVAQLLEDGANVNISGFNFLGRGSYHQSRGSDSILPLHIACWKGYEDIVALFLERGADANVSSERSGNALQIATRNGRTDVLNLLLDNGANPDTESRLQSNALAYAIQQDATQIVGLLLEKGADPNAHGRLQASAIEIASQNGNIEIVKSLLDHGAYPNAHSKLQSSPLECATQQNAIEILKLLLDQGADPNAHSEQNGSALEIASRNEDVEIVKSLLDKGANPNAHSRRTGSALEAACWKNHPELVKLLLDKSADPNAHSGRVASALEIASDNGYTGIVKLLLDHGADPDAYDKLQGSALEYATQQNATEIVKLLLDKGANPDKGVGPNTRAELQGNACEAASYEKIADEASNSHSNETTTSCESCHHKGATCTASPQNQIQCTELQPNNQACLITRRECTDFVDEHITKKPRYLISDPTAPNASLSNSTDDLLYQEAAFTWPRPGDRRRSLCDLHFYPLEKLTQSDEIWYLEFSHDGSMLATACRDGLVSVYSTKSWLIMHEFREHAQDPSEHDGVGVRYIAFSPNDRYLISCSERCEFIVMDVFRGCMVCKCDHFDYPVTAVAWLPDSMSFVVGTQSTRRPLGLYTMRLADSDGPSQSVEIHSWREPRSEYGSGNNLRVTDVTVSRDGRQMASTTTDNRIMIYDLSSRKKINEWPMEGKLLSVNYSDDGMLLLVNEAGEISMSSLWMLDSATGEKMMYYKGAQQERDVIRSRFGGAGESFVTSGSEGKIQVSIRHCASPSSRILT